MLTFFTLPAEHWPHVRTTNVIESPFATVRLRQRVTKGAGSRTKGLLMAYKLLEMAQQRWRRLNGAHLLPLVRAGVSFIDGVQQERKTENKGGDRVEDLYRTRFPGHTFVLWRIRPPWCCSLRKVCTCCGVSFASG